MTKTLDELRQRAEELGCDIVTENPDGGDPDGSYGEDDLHPGCQLYWIVDQAAGGYVGWPGLPLDEIEELLDYLEETNRPPTVVTAEDRAKIAQKIAAQPTTTTEGSSGKKIPRFIETELAGQMDLFRDA